MPNLNLTEISVRALKGSDRYQTYWDTNTPAFGIRVGKRSKTWTVMRGKNRERLTIGRFPDITVSQARAEAKRLLSAEPEPKAVSRTFPEARAIFLAEHYRTKKPRTQAEATRLLEKHFKNLEAMQLADIDDTHISTALAKLAKTPSEQLHAYRTARCFFRWCVRPPRRFIKHSPMEGYEPPGSDKQGTRVLTDEELRAVWEAAQAPPHAVIRLLVLWGTRPSETTLMERSWLYAGTLVIPGEATKNGRDHGIPICPLARQTLDLFPGNERYFFRSRWGEGHLTYSGIAKLAKEVRIASGTKGWTMRDLRRTFRSNMARMKVPRDICEVLINHAPPVLDQIYDKYDRIEEKREALAKYEAALIWLLAKA